MSGTDKELRKKYHECYQNIVQFLLTETLALKEKAKNAKSNPKDRQIEFACLYEEELLKRIYPMLQEVARELHLKHKIKIKSSFIQFNSLNVNINARIRLPWYGTDGNSSVQEGGNPKTQAPFDDLKWKAKQKEWTDEYQKPNGLAQANHRDLMYLQPDRPTHLMTEILWRLKPSKSHDPNKGWIGIMKNNSNLKGNPFSDHVFHATDRGTFSVSFLEKLNVLKNNNDDPLVKLGRDYKEEDNHNLVKTAEIWLWGGELEGGSGNRVQVVEHDNIFYLPDITESEQLSGIDMELDLNGLDGLPEDAALETLNALLYDCQWLISQYVTSLISRVEKAHSASGGVYRDMYFSQKDDGTYPMLESLVDGCDGNEGFLCWDRYKADFSNPDNHFLKNIFDKVRTHFEVAKGTRGDYWLGYNSHAYEVACTVAGIMDVLFEFGNYGPKINDKPKRSSIEDIVRRSGPHLEKIQEALHNDKDIPYLFEQIFQGLVTEHQLFLTPMYREHFIHSFYVFVFGLIFMSVAPSKVIRGQLILKSHKNKTDCQEFLKQWFLVSMWHDIAYIIQKGNEVLENYVTRFMRDRVRYKGLLPWIPGLGNLMQVDRLLGEIRILSENAVELDLNILKETWNESEDNITDNAKRFEDGLSRLSADIVIAAAFERCDHGVWSALMINHGWDEIMTLFFHDTANLSLKTRKIIANAIMPHHLADWKVEDLIKSFDFLKGEKHKKIFKEKMKKAKETKSLNRNFSNEKNRDWVLATVSYKSNPLGYLLSLTDMVCQAGREAPELAGDVPSDLRIRFDDLEQKNTEKNHETLCVRLYYEKKEHQNSNSLKEFYQNPASSIGLDSYTSVKVGGNLQIEIEQDGKKPCEENPHVYFFLYGV